MKPNRVATLNARKFMPVFQSVKNSGILLLISFLFLIISCDKSDDLETIGNELPIDIESVIVYTDLEQDFTSQNIGDSYNLDLNNDQIIDFIVSSSFDILEDSEWLGIASNQIANNGIISVTPWYSNAVPLNSGEKISNLLEYRNGESYQPGSIMGYCFTGEQDCSYDWKDKVDKYLGLRFIINGQTHYGWVRLDVTSLTQWVIKDYAYNATPNKPILAGQMN